MTDYSKPQKIIAEHLYFHFKGCKYSGRGVINWKPELGFHLEAFMDNSLLISEQLEIGRVRVPTRLDYCSIRMWTNDFGWAIIPSVNLSNFQMELLQKNLSFKFNRIVLCEPSQPRLASSSWSGSAFYCIKSQHQFTDKVTVQTHVDRELVESRGSNGFLYEKDGMKLVGRFIDKKHFHLNWTLPKQRYTKADAWNWPVGFQDALRIWLGQTVQLLRRQMIRGTQKVVEIQKEEQIEELGIFLSLFGNAPIQKELIVHLANFMSGNHKNSIVCRSIFEQILEASRQRLQASQELLIATVIEATMRTLYNYPARPKDNSQGLLRQTLSGRFKESDLNFV